MENKKLNFLDRILEIIAAAIVFALVVLVLRSVVARYLFGSSDPYTQELTRLLFPWLVFIGSALAIRRKANLSVTLVFERLPERARPVVSVVTSILTIVFLTCLVVKGFLFAFSTWDQVTSSLAMRKTWFYLSVPVGGLFMLAATVEDLALQLRRGSSLRSTGSS
ncbi:MAG TPA: TRAP transporter small permease [Firmicutes bacterium]|nr:TRAP transporter small permease [Bacillota bacterium]